MLRDATPGNDGADDALRVRPSEAVVHLVEGVADPLRFAATFVTADGETRDVTPEATFEVAPASLGEFRGPVFHANPAVSGRGAVIARYGRWHGRGSIAVSEVILREGVDPEEPERFALDAAAAIAPRIVQPPDGALLPPNLFGLQWLIRTERHHTFELRFSGPGLEVREYFRCTPVDGPCYHTVEADLWDRVVGEGRAGTEIEYQVRGRGGAGRYQVGSSDVRRFRLAGEAIGGGVYYWDAASGDVMRHEFGTRAPIAETFLNGLPDHPEYCVGCHDVSRGGANISVQVRTLDAPSFGFATLDVASRTTMFWSPPAPGGRVAYSSFSPTGDAIVSISGDLMTIRSARTGELIEMATIGAGSMPSFSPDGLEVAYSRFGGSSSEVTPGMRPRGISVVRRTETGWMPAREVVAAEGGDGLRCFDPQWSPDGQWLLMTRSTGPDGPYGAPPGELWVAAADGSVILSLEALSTGRESWPRWDTSAYVEQEEPLFWFIFSSRRPIEGRGDAGAAQLWMSAFRPQLAARGESPMTPPFRLPFQAPHTDNFMGQLVTQIQRQPCDEDPVCPSGEMCREGRCVPILE